MRSVKVKMRNRYTEEGQQLVVFSINILYWDFKKGKRFKIARVDISPVNVKNIDRDKLSALAPHLPYNRWTNLDIQPLKIFKEIISDFVNLDSLIKSFHIKPAGEE